jgi:hypothetical protein
MILSILRKNKKAVSPDIDISVEMHFVFAPIKKLKIQQIIEST